MRVIFMGTPEFAVASLEAIVAAGYDVPLVVTVPDRPQGRGRQTMASAVGRAAQGLGLKVATPESLKDPLFLDQVRSLAADVICVVAFRILPEVLYALPPKGSFNLHGSLLPKYRGAAPINRAIINGESQTGVTTFFLQKKVDTGTMILQRSIPIGEETTAGELHDAMMMVGAEVVVETLQLIESGNVHPQSQNDAAATPAPKIFRDDCRINWNTPSVALHNLVRGLSPWPGAFTTLNGMVLKILRTRRSNRAESLPPGRVLMEGEHLFIGTADRPVEVLVLQQEGKRALETAPFLRGHAFDPGTLLGT